MSVRMHISHSKTRSRRSHHRVEMPTLVKDAQSGTARMRHFADPNTGMYRGKQILNLGKKTQKQANLKSRKAARKAPADESK